MLSFYNRYNITCELNPKFGAISSFHNMYISTLSLANKCFPPALQLRKTKLRNRPPGTKNTEIIGDVKKSIVCDLGEIISTTRPEKISLTAETGRSPPRYTMYY